MQCTIILFPFVAQWDQVLALQIWWTNHCSPYSCTSLLFRLHSIFSLAFSFPRPKEVDVFMFILTKKVFCLPWWPALPKLFSVPSCLSGRAGQSKTQCSSNWCPQVSSRSGPCFLYCPPDNNLYVADLFDAEPHKLLLSSENKTEWFYIFTAKQKPSCIQYKLHLFISDSFSYLGIH